MNGCSSSRSFFLAALLLVLLLIYGLHSDRSLHASSASPPRVKTAPKEGIHDFAICASLADPIQTVQNPLARDVAEMMRLESNWGQPLWDTDDVSLQDDWRAAQARSRNLGDLRSAGAFGAGLAWLRTGRGDLAGALELLDESLKVLHRAQDIEATAAVLSYRGTTLRHMARYTEALRDFDQVLSTADRMQSRSRTAEAQANIGATYWYMGEPAKALASLQAALASYEAETRNPMFESALLANIGNLQLCSLQLDEALKSFQRAIAIRLDLALRAVTQPKLSDMAVDYKATGELGSALPQATNLGLLMGPQQARIAEGWRTLLQSLSASDNIQLFDQISTAHINIASREVGLQRPDPALRSCLHALQLSEFIRERYSGGPQDPYSTLSAIDAHSELIDLLEKLHVAYPEGDFAAKAFEIFEHKQGRILLREVAKSGARRYGLPKAITESRSKLAAAEIQLRNELAAARSGLFVNKSRVAELETQLAQAIASRQSYELDIQSNYPGYHHLLAARPAGQEELRQNVLRDGELLLAYHVGKTSSTLWALTQESFAMFPLALGETSLKEKIERLRNSLMFPTDTRGVTPVDRYKRQIRLREVTSDLFKALVPQPARTLLTGATGVFIVPSGPLYRLPFETLMTPGESSSTGEPKYLIEKIKISYVSSGTLLRTLRATERGKGRHPQYPLLAFADPAYGVKAGFAEVDAVTLARAATYKRLIGDSLEELPESAAEAREISRHLGAPEESYPLQLREAASRSAVLLYHEADLLSNYRYLLFATHGLLPGETDGLLQAALVLSGRDANRYLTMGDVLGLDLNADLVVLSACNSAGGSAMRSEGILGLTSAFMYAGARAVAATLWAVETYSVKHLSVGLFEELARQSGPAAALQAVKVRMLRGEMTEDYRDPYFWAPMVLFGDGA